MGGFFYLFIHYSHATYGDHGEIMCSPVPVRCPRSGGTLLAPRCPPPRPVPRRCGAHQGKYKEKTNEKDKFTGLALSGERHEVRRGKEQWWPLPVRLLSASSLLLHPPHGVILLPRHLPPHIRRREEV